MNSETEPAGLGGANGPTDMKKRGSTSTEPTSVDLCYFCGAKENLRYCSLCKKFFCHKCEKRYAARIVSMIAEAVRKLLAIPR